LKKVDRFIAVDFDLRIPYYQEIVVGFSNATYSYIQIQYKFS